MQKLYWEKANSALQEPVSQHVFLTALLLGFGTCTCFLGLTWLSPHRYLQEILAQAESVVDELNRKKKNADFHNQKLEATKKDGYIGKGDDWISKVCGSGQNHLTMTDDVVSIANCFIWLDCSIGLSRGRPKSSQKPHCKQHGRCARARQIWDVSLAIW